MAVKTPKKKITLPRTAVAALVILGGLAAFLLLRPDLRQTASVPVNDGTGTVWIEPVRNLPAATFESSDFVRRGAAVAYIGGDFAACQGVDVSEWQKTVRWDEVAAGGIDFAVIRCGFRRYASGNLEQDELFEANYVGAGSAGLRRGVYFFSQAVSAEEAREEAEYVLRLLDGRTLELPVFYDWETVSAADGRANGLDGATVTACAAAFCRTVEAAGYEAGLYFNLQMGYHTYDLSHFTDRTLWLAEPGTHPTFYYHTALWQYDHRAAVPGIDTEVDLNLLFEPKKQ